MNRREKHVFPSSIHVFLPPVYVFPSHIHIFQGEN